MKNLDVIAKDLFNKIRGRFPNITIGDTEGNVTNVPNDARYFDFSFSDEKEKKISVSLDEDNGIVVIVGKDIVSNQPEAVQDKWYKFLKELRVFAKKRLLNFDVRDINKTNLNKRDYKFLATTRPGDKSMAESKMYGTNKTSYQRIGNARLAIKHSQAINVESAAGRSQKIGAIYIESPEGERFKYPYKHIAGARAMARHVSEGGNAYDDFGKYISGLSEEASKLQKFKKYMNRSSVMAETLSGYMETVNTRIQEVKKEITHLQREAFYKEAVANFTVPVVEDVPEDVAENWIDQLTIKQFNEELKDVFPYIYKLVGEATRAKELGPEDLMSEADEHTEMNESNDYLDSVIQAHQQEFDQFIATGEIDTTGDLYNEMYEYYANEMNPRQRRNMEAQYDYITGKLRELGAMKNEAWVKEAEKKGLYYYVNKRKKAGTSRPKNHPKAPSAQDWKNAAKTAKEELEIEAAFESLMGQFAENSVDEGLGKKLAILALLGLTGYGAMKATSPVNSPLGQALQSAAEQGDKEAAYHLSKLGAYVDAGDSQTLKQLNFQYIDEPAAMKDDATVPNDSVSSPLTMTQEKPKTPIGEFILSYFDRETGKFPKGETAVLTAVQKDYGDQYVKPAVEFIKKVEAISAKRKVEKIQNSPHPETEMIKHLAGV
jgi:hypothetical protein